MFSSIKWRCGSYCLAYFQTYSLGRCLLSPLVLPLPVSGPYFNAQYPIHCGWMRSVWGLGCSPVEGGGEARSTLTQDADVAWSELLLGLWTWLSLLLLLLERAATELEKGQTTSPSPLRSQYSSWQRKGAKIHKINFLLNDAEALLV